MSDQIIVNGTPSTATQWWIVFRLYQALLGAGWTVAYSSDGTTHNTSDNWAAGFGSLGTSAYIILTGKGGRQVAFQRSSTSTSAGYMYYARGGSWGTSGANATTLPTSPSNTVTIRNNVNWFGTSSTPVKFNIWASDISSSDGDFQVVFSTSTGWTSGGGGFIGFCALESTESEDDEPYAWWSPASGSNWSSLLNDVRCVLYTDSGSSPGTSIWYKWYKWGLTGAAWSAYSGGGIYPGSSGSGAVTWGQAPAWNSTGDTSPYDSDVVLHRVRLLRTNGSPRDFNGGVVKRLFFATPGDVPNLRTIGNATYAKLGSWLVVAWDGNALNPPAES